MVLLSVLSLRIYKKKGVIPIEIEKVNLKTGKRCVKWAQCIRLAIKYWISWVKPKIIVKEESSNKKKPNK